MKYNTKFQEVQGFIGLMFYMCTTFNVRLKNTTPKYVSSKKTHVWFAQKKTKKAPQKKKKHQTNTQNNLSRKRNNSHFPIFQRLERPLHRSVCLPVSSGSRGATDMSCNLKPMIIKSNLGSASNHRLPRWFVGPHTGLVFAELPGRKILDDTEGGKIA